MIYARHMYYFDVNEDEGENQDILYINFARHPIKQFVSAFYFTKQLGWLAMIIYLTRENIVSCPTFCTFEVMSMSLNFQTMHPTIEDQLYHMVDGSNVTYLQIPFYCGQDVRCKQLNNGWALAKAIEHVQKRYIVVGIVEEFNKSLAVFEHLVPRFFYRAVPLCQKYQLHANKGQLVEQITDETIISIRNHLRNEIIFYDFLKKRLLTQFDQIRGKLVS